MFPYCFSLLLVLLSSAPAATKIVSPDPLFDCANPKFHLTYTACQAGDYSQCCPVASACCAGGCCSLTSFCVNVGTSNEGCCSYTDSDLNLCGTDVADLQIPVICFSGLRGGGSYQCPFGSECGTDDDTCSSTEKPPLAKATNVAAADASSTKAASRTTGSPVASGADTPEVSATSGGKGASVALATGSPGQNPSAASKSVAVFSFTIVVASVVMVVVLL